MSSLPLGAGNSPSSPSQIGHERLGDGESGGILGWRARERDVQQTTEGAVSTALAPRGRGEVGGGWWKDKGVVMRSKPPGSCINFFSTTCVLGGMVEVVAADDSCRPISPARSFITGVLTLKSVSTYC